MVKVRVATLKNDKVRRDGHWRVATSICRGNVGILYPGPTPSNCSIPLGHFPDWEKSAKRVESIRRHHPLAMVANGWDVESWSWWLLPPPLLSEAVAFCIFVTEEKHEKR